MADVTYIRLMAQFVYLAVLLDAYSRKVVGWGLSRRLDATLTCAALKAAIASRRPPVDCIHHSDRGVQYASHEYVKLLTEHGFQISMSRKGNPYDNAQAESFLKTLKTEEAYLWEYRSFDEVNERIERFIKEVYNRKRLHSALGYQSPEQFEMAFTPMQGSLERSSQFCPA
ncbi:MAG: IS3 family transposase [Deltaproteobacteria bacterium]|nr:IS3 family transposase [Deltaproteobacteria bacterium]